MGNKIKINKTLIWDYDFEKKIGTEEFNRWYISCVLTRGTARDIRAIGFKTIREYLPSLNLPRRIKEFWIWYFNYGDSDRISGKVT